MNQDSEVKSQVHTRGTPPNVAKMEGQVLIELFQNPDLRDKFCHNCQISALGARANIQGVVTEASKLGLGSRKEK